MNRLLCVSVLVTTSLVTTSFTLLPPNAPQTKSTGAQDTSQTSAQTKGKNIGEIISSAFDTAFPIVGKIMDVFKSKPTTSAAGTAEKNKTNPPASAPPAAEKIATESEVQAAVNKAQSDAKSTFKAQIQPITEVAQELGVVQILATDGSIAKQNIVNIQRMLAQTSPDYSKIGTEWKKFSQQMAEVLTMDEAKIKLVQEAGIRGKILDLQKTRSQLMIDISDNIDRAKGSAKDFSKREFERQISAMGELLNGFDSLAAAELEVLQGDIDNIAKWANTPAGKSNFKTPAANPALLSIAAEAVRKGQAAYHVNFKEQ
jgi:hypothetical protein